MAAPRQNTIVSHGGKTGKGGTHLRGVEVSERVQKQIPSHLLDATASPVAAPPQRAARTITPQRAAAKASAEPVKAPTTVDELHAMKKADVKRLAKEMNIDFGPSRNVTLDEMRARLTAELGLE